MGFDPISKNAQLLFDTHVDAPVSLTHTLA